MHLYTQLYEFAASVGALEGFVYRRPDVQAGTIVKWVENLEKAYGLLPEEVLKEIQPALDGTLGRAVKSVSAALGEGAGRFIVVHGMQNATRAEVFFE